MKAIIIGATGAVGTELVKSLLSRPEIEKITLLLRRKHSDPFISASSKVDQHLVNLGDSYSYAGLMSGHDLAFSTLGIGEPSKSHKDEFIKIDKDYVLGFAENCKKSNIRHFTSLGAVGSNSESRILYTKIKGQLEDGLRKLKFPRLSLIRPSMIMTPNNRYGWTQALALKLFPKIDPYLTGSWTQYRSIKVEDLGKAMALNAFKPATNPTEILTWQELQNLI